MDKRLRICFLSQYLGEVNRGAETFVLELSKRLSETYDVDILLGNDSFSISKIVCGHYDFVIPTNGRWQALIASVGRIFGGYKTIISGQAGRGKDDIWNIFITMPNVYVALTDYEMKWAKNWAFFTKLVKIPNGVDLEKFNPVGEKISLNLPKPIILSVGALYWYKHHERSIKAVSKLEKGSLLIVGSGSELVKLKELGNRLLGDRFKIISADYQELPKYYRSVDLFVLPSWERESFGIVYLEAMASGLAVVAPNDSSRREIVGAAGILIDVTDTEKYEQAVGDALQKKWGDSPRKQADKFSWDIIAKKYEELFKNP